MSTISSFTMFQTSNLVCQNVNLADELTIGLEYDNHNGLLNVFVKNIGDHTQFPSKINIFSNENHDSDNQKYLSRSSEFQQNFQDEINDIFYREENEPKICIELSNIYVYDLYDEDEAENENENIPCQTMITSPSLLFSSSSSSSCFDDHTIDNDDGYSTHSMDDTEQQQSLSIPPSKFIVPFVRYQHQFYSEEYVSSIRRLIDQMLWLNPFKKTVKQMMKNHLFN